MLTGNRSYEIPHKSDPQFYWMTHGIDVLMNDWGVDPSDEALDLLRNMLQIDPRLRLTIDEVENHPWFAQPDVPPS
jgi:serine/threonine protein kinase